MQIAQLRTADIAYHEEGEGSPILLIHGFASKASINWMGVNWVTTLVEAGFRVVAMDNRGHGESQKFYGQDDYTLVKMAEDASELLSYLNIEQADIMGYSLGARISATMANNHPGQVKRLILAGNGYNMIEGGFDTSEIYDGLMAETIDDVKTKIGIEFRAFAQQTKSDLRALAACIRGGRNHISRSVFETLPHETLVTVGTKDTVAIDGEKLASIIPNGKFMAIPERNHMNAVGDKAYKQNVLEFLSS